jgi:hypothetical protein
MMLSRPVKLKSFERWLGVTETVTLPNISSSRSRLSRLTSHTSWRNWARMTAQKRLLSERDAGLSNSEKLKRKCPDYSPKVA